MVPQLYAIIIGALIIGALLFVFGRYFSLWFQAYLSGARVPIWSLVAMSLRKVPPDIVVRCRIMAVQAGLDDFSWQAVEAQYLAGGNVLRVTLALIIAHRAGIPLDWDTAAAIDLAGRDIVEAVQVSVNPKVIDCPDPASARGNTLDGVAQDGIQLKVRVRVTVRTNLSQLIGGATEATVIARVGQGVVSAIGSCQSYKQALSDPLLVTRQVISQGLDAQTAFAIVSIDIADIDVGTNIGARLQIDQANTDIRIAVAEAEKRRALAVAREQEMLALTREHQAAVVLAESRIPEAIAAAFRNGQLVVTDPNSSAPDQPQRIQSASGRTSPSFPALGYSAPTVRPAR